MLPPITECLSATAGSFLNHFRLINEKCLTSTAQCGHVRGADALWFKLRCIWRAAVHTFFTSSDERCMRRPGRCAHFFTSPGGLLKNPIDDTDIERWYILLQGNCIRAGVCVYWIYKCVYIFKSRAVGWRRLMREINFAKLRKMNWIN